jgi:hypothetical protein
MVLSGGNLGGQAAQLLLDFGVDLVLSEFGSHAHRILDGIRVG